MVTYTLDVLDSKSFVVNPGYVDGGNFAGSHTFLTLASPQGLQNSSI